MSNTPPGAAGITGNEIDLTGAKAIVPIGIPAGVIGASQRGPAFVPSTVANLSQFITKFGGMKAGSFGPFAVREWLQRGPRMAATFTRVLGVGTGKKRNADGSVTSAGFVVGDKQVQANGVVGNNAYAGPASVTGAATATATVNSDSAPASVLRTGVGAIISNAGADTAGAGIVVQSSSTTTNDDAQFTIACTDVGFKDDDGATILATHTVILKNVNAGAIPAAPAATVHIACSDGVAGSSPVGGEVIAKRIVAAFERDNTADLGVGGLNWSGTYDQLFEFGSGWQLSRPASADTPDADSVIVALTTTPDVGLDDEGVRLQLRGYNGAAWPWGTAGAYGGDVLAGDAAWAVTPDVNLGAGASATAATIAASGRVAGTTAGASTFVLDPASTAATTFTANSTDSDLGFIVSGHATPVTAAATTATNLAAKITADADFTCPAPAAAQITITNDVDAAAVGDGNSATITVNNFTAGAWDLQGVATAADPTSSNFTGGTPPCSIAGRTYFLGCFMSASFGSPIWVDSGVAKVKNVGPVTGSLPVIRGVLMVPSGVVATMSGSFSNNDVLQGSSTAAADTTTFAGATASPTDGGNAGAMIGDVVVKPGLQQDFKILLNGHIATEQYSNVLDLSFRPEAGKYISKALNTDPTKMEEAGHLLYSHFNVYESMAVITASNSAISGTSVHTPQTLAQGNIVAGDLQKGVGFLMTSSLPRATSHASGANYESFEDRYSAAKTPFITSQDFGNGPQNLFRLYALSDGSGPLDWTVITEAIPSGQFINSGRLKLTISNIQKSLNTVAGARYGQFDVEIRKIDDIDSDTTKKPIEKFVSVNLDPTSDDFIGKRIGDQRLFYDFDNVVGEQRLVLEGSYPNKSSLVRVQLADEVLKGYPAGISDTALPIGSRGIAHIISSGSVAFNYAPDYGWSPGGQTLYHERPFEDMRTPPVPLRQHMQEGSGTTSTVNTSYGWGVMFTCPKDLSKPNQDVQFNDGIFGFTKFYPDYQTSGATFSIGNNPGAAIDANLGVVDCDKFMNNVFSLDRVQILTASTIDQADPELWKAAQYRRDGVLAPLTIPGLYTDGAEEAFPLISTYAGSDERTRFLNVDKDFISQNRPFLKFNTLFQGGFDGVDIFNSAKANLRNVACRREADDVLGQGGTAAGPTITAYKRAVDITAERSATEINLLTIPGLRHPSITDYTIDAIEDRFDAMYIMDIEEQDALGNYVTSSADSIVNVTNTVNAFAGRGLNSSFAAAYFPDVLLNEANNAESVPPSVVVLGAYSRNDATSKVWFAPAGMNRAKLTSAQQVAVQLNQANQNKLYDNDINPIIDTPESSVPLIMGQKTLLTAQSALDRVNIRRLLIHIRRRVREVSNKILFEPNRASTLANFSAKITPILTEIQAGQGLNKFKVVIDASTTTQADVENNTIRGRIILQPTFTIEFIELDFVLTNTIDDDAL